MKHTLLVRGKFQKLDANSTSITGAKPSAMHLKKNWRSEEHPPKGSTLSLFYSHGNKVIEAQGVGCHWAA